MISEKQKKILAFPYSKYDALICDGAIRSGKTTIMMVAFVDWAMREFSGQRFGICGKTVGSATENIIIPYISMTRTKKKYTAKWRRSQKILEVRWGRKINYFEVFGGRDESSYTLIQGRTLAGVRLDEVVLMLESFVNQALARCSVEGAKFWFSCNPGNPNHWFKKEWIDQREDHNALYLYFGMADNPSLSQKTLNRYLSMYTGVFYDRYIRGLWVAAEGLVYRYFANHTEEFLIDDPLRWCKESHKRFYKKKMQINDRIKLTILLMAQKQLFIVRKCEHMIDAFQTAVYDPKSFEDVRLGDGTSAIYQTAVDAQLYYQGESPTINR